MNKILKNNQIFDELLIKFSNSTKIFDSALRPTIKSVCHTLRIAKMKLYIYKDEQHESKKKGRNIILYDGEDAKRGSKLHKRYKAQNGEIAVFEISPIKNEEPWNSLELDKIQVFAMILFTFGERNQNSRRVHLEEDEQTKKIEELFPQAIKNEEFKVYYQPKVLLKNYQLNGAEALCRWQHDGKIIPPNEFIPILEKSKLICELDFYMFEHVCKDISTWLSEDKKVVKISVNLSRQNIGMPNLLEKIISIADKYKVPHELIEIELVETGTELSNNDLVGLVSGLRQNGISIAVDDFGTGFSSFALVRDLAWNIIKIDRSLLPNNTDENSEQYMLVSHLLSMLCDMGFKCVFEGAETIEQIKMLRDNNCHEVQGFYFDKPLPKDEFETRLDALQKSID